MARIYPSWRFHRDLVQTQIVHSAAEDAAMGPDWADTPARWTEAPVQEPEPEPTAPQPAEATPARVVRRCKTCGEVGHNASTCALAQQQRVTFEVGPDQEINIQ